MANFDFKTAVPDTNIAGTEYWFGADSQSAATPSIYSIGGLKTYLLGGGSLAITAAKTLTATNSLTLTGTDGTTMTFPSSSATLAGLGIANLFTTAQTISPVTDVTALTARSSAGGTSNILQLQDSSNNVLAAFDSSGLLTLGRGSGLTGQLKFANSTNANVLTLQAGATSGSLTFTLPTADGTSGQVLQTNGSGVLSWKTDATNSPGGSDTQVQFNNSGSFGADSTLTFNSTTKQLTAQKFGLSGNISSAAWTTNGIRYSNSSATITDTSSSGTVATAYTNVYGGNTIAASNSTTFTNYYNTFIAAPVSGTNVTFTNAWALGLGGAAQIAAGTLNATVLDISQAWSGTGTYTGLKYNVSADSGPANQNSNFIDLQIGGSSKFRIDKNGSAVAATTGGFSCGANNGIDNNRTYSSTYAVGTGFATDCLLTRRGAANLRLGAADAAAPVAQTLSVQSVVAGTTDTAGTNFTITGSQGTGTGAAGNILFQTASSAASTGTAQNSLATVMTVGPNTLTGSQATSLLDLAQTWNTTGTPTALKLNVTNTASNSSSLLMDLQVGGSSQFNVRNDGYTTAKWLGTGTLGIEMWATDTGQYTRTVSAGRTFAIAPGNGSIPYISIAANALIAWNSVSGATNVDSANFGLADLFLTRRGAANLRLGRTDTAASSQTYTADSTTDELTAGAAHGLMTGAAITFSNSGGALPTGISAATVYYAVVTSTTKIKIATSYANATASSPTVVDITANGSGTTTGLASSTQQSLSVQSFTGTNVSGSPLVINGSQGTGTGAGGSIIFQVAPAGSSGTSQNALATALEINSAGKATFLTAATSGIYLNDNATGLIGFYHSGTRRSYIYGQSNGFLEIVTSNAQYLSLSGAGGIRIDSGLYFSYFFTEEANHIFAQRLTSSPQTYRIYNTWTSSTNYERGKLEWSGSVFNIGTEKGSGGGSAQAMALQTDGTNRLIISTAGLLQVAGTTSSFPALKRSSTTLQVRLADDSADAPLSAANITSSGNITANGSTSVIGYATGSGGAVTQATDRTTGVTLNKSNGAITLVSAAGTTSWQTFTVTNSTVAATDTVIVSQKSGTDKNQIFVTAVAAGSFDITFATTGGTTTEQPVFNFAVIKAVAA